MRPSAHIAFSLISALLLGWSPVCAADDQWRQLEQMGEAHDAQTQFQTAVGEYEQAAKLVPPQCQDASVEIEAQAASDYIRLNQAAKAKPHVERAIELVEGMRALHREPSDDALYALGGTLSEAKSHPHLEPVLRLGMAVEICERVMPRRGDLVGIELDYAEALADDKQLQKAERQLRHVLQQVCKTEKDKSQVDLRLAAIEEREGRAEHMQRLSEMLSKTESPTWRWRQIANAQMFAGELEKANESADAALQALSKLNKQYPTVEAGLCGFKFKIYQRKGEFKEAEKWARRRLAVLRALDRQSGDAASAANDLAEVLRQQNKNEKAEAVKLAQPLGYDLFVTDSDKKALERASQGHPSSPWSP
jgi:hypothetical protein